MVAKKRPRDVDCDIVWCGWASRCAKGERRIAAPPAFVMQIVAPDAAPRSAAAAAAPRALHLALRRLQPL